MYATYKTILEVGREGDSGVRFTSYIIQIKNEHVLKNNSQILELKTDLMLSFTPKFISP
jgi:hypothetical protein